MKNASIISLTATSLHFNWGTDGLVLWIDEFNNTDNLIAQMNEVLERIAFAIELQTGWDDRSDTYTIHPLYGYRLLLRDASGCWNLVRINELGQFISLTTLQEMNYEIAYDKVMWMD